MHFRSTCISSHYKLSISSSKTAYRMMASSGLVGITKSFSSMIIVTNSVKLASQPLGGSFLQHLSSAITKS